MTSFALRAAACGTVLAAVAVSAPAHAAPAATARVAGFVVTPTTVAAGKSITVKGQAQRLVGKTWRATAATAVVSFDPDGAAPASAVRTLKSDAKGNVATSFTASRSGNWSITLKPASASKAAVSARIHVNVLAARLSAPAKSAGPLVVVMAKGSISCPAYAPIKGNLTSHIFHMPGQSAYARTHPEFCFATPAAALAKGFRAAKR